MSPYKILLVDDNEVSQKLLKAVYEQDYEVVTAADGLEALEVLEHDKIDLILSDILMPNMDGYRLSYKIRTNDKLKDIPIIIYSALHPAQTEEKLSRDMGANMYIRKPAPFEVLSAVVKKILADPQKYPHGTPTAPEPVEQMRQFNRKLIIELEQSNIELEETKTKLEYSEARLKQAQTIAGVGSWELDFATNVVQWSEEACRIYGISADENKQSLGSSLSFIHPEDLLFVTKTINDSQSSMFDNSFYHRVIRKDEAIRFFHTKTHFDYDDLGQPRGLYGISQDITDMKEMEEDLRKSETRLRTIFENTTVGFLLMDSENIVVAANSISAEWSKILIDQPLTPGMNLRENLLPERLGEFDRLMEVIKQGGQINYEANYPASDGTLNWFQVSGKPVKEINGKVIGVCFAANNITERKKSETEINKLNQHLEEMVLERTVELTEANKALEAFSYSVSHDLRAPIRAVRGFTKIIDQQYGPAMAPEMKELFGFIDANSKRMTAIIDDLLKLAQYGKEKLIIEPVNMALLIKSVWSNLGRHKANNAILQVAELPVVEADMSMMEQVVTNLLSNAIKYSSKKEKPVVKVWAETTNENITYYFKDNGAGFDMENYELLFGAFQRFHSMADFEGTGVGLTLVKNIIEKHGGTIAAEAKVDEGATFYFTLPVKQPEDLKAADE